MSITVRGKGTTKRYLVRVAGYPSKTVYTRDAATTLEAKLKNDRALGHTRQVEPTTLAHELDSYNQRRDATQTFRPDTKDGHEVVARAWKTLRPHRIPALSRQLVEDTFVERCKTAPVQANRELQWLKAVLRDAAARGQQVDPGIFAIKPAQHKPRRGRALTVEQLYALATFMPEYIQRIVPLAGMVGARQSFWFQVTDDMVDLDRGTMLAPAELMKNGREHMVALTQAEIKLFREQLVVRQAGTPLIFPTSTGLRWNRHNFRQLVWYKGIEAAAEADPVFGGFRFHWLRHSAASNMARAGITPPIAAERLGHTDGGALYLRTYRHLMAGEQEQAAKRLDAFVSAELREARKRAAS
jgi:integrase